MYGFGDDANPRQDTVELVEDLMIEYIETIVHINNPVHPPSFYLFQLHQAHKVALLHGGKVKTDDLLFVLRKDTKKYARVEELLYMNEEVRKAKKAFDTDEVPQTTTQSTSNS